MYQEEIAFHVTKRKEREHRSDTCGARDLTRHTRQVSFQGALSPATCSSPYLTHTSVLFSEVSPDLMELSTNVMLCYVLSKHLLNCGIHDYAPFLGSSKEKTISSLSLQSGSGTQTG